MSKIVSLDIAGPDRAQIDAMMLSVAALATVLVSSEDVADGRSGALMALYDAGDIVRIEVTSGAAGGAIELHGLQIEPTDRYLELVSAVADDTDAYSVSIRHGWPILSVVAPPPTVADGGVGESPAPGGRAHG